MASSAASTLEVPKKTTFKRLVYKTGRKAKVAYCYEVKPGEVEKAKCENRMQKLAGKAAKMTASAAGSVCKKTGKVIKKTSIIWPIRILLGFLDVLALPYGKMRGRDINFPLLWKAGAILLVLDVWIFLLIDSVGGRIVQDRASAGIIFALAQTLIPGGIALGAISLIIGGIRLQQGKSFSQKYGAELEPLPAFESGVIFKIGDLKLSLRDMHTNIGAFGGIGTGKGHCVSSSISTTYGRVKLNVVAVGDKILSPTGKEETVLDVVYLGEQTLWHLQTEDGLLTKCTSDHLWLVKEQGQEGEILTQTGSLAELISQGKTFFVQTEASNFDWVKITSIHEAQEREECRCLILSGTDHLYIADGIVTHNCLDPEQDVLMFDGTLKKVKNLQPGDFLMGPDGKARRIMVTSTGYGPLYRIVPIYGKGKPWICNDAHVMTLQYTSRNGSRPARVTPNGIVEKDHSDRIKHYKGISQVFGETLSKTSRRRQQKLLEEKDYTADVPLKDFIARKAPSRSLSHFWKLFRAPGIEFPNDEEHDPSRFRYTHEALNEEEFYLAGAWIGDGIISSGWCNQDDVIKTSVKRYLTELADNKRDFNVYIQNPEKPEFEVITPRGIGHGGAISNLEKYLLEFTTASFEQKGQGRNLANMYKRFGGQYDKDIPNWALTAPRIKRLELLAGILDTDGSYDEPCHCFDLTQKRLWIVEKTVWLCRSLGLAACEPYESWKKAKNGTKILPTIAELQADPGLLKDFVERGILKLALHLKEGKISQVEHNELVTAFQGLTNPAPKLLLTPAPAGGFENFSDFVRHELPRDPDYLTWDEAKTRRDLEALLLLHESEKRERYWRTAISGDIHLIPTRVPSKQVSRLRAETRLDGRDIEHIDSRDTKDELCFGWDAEPIGEGPYCGFTLDGDGRFLLGDFTVTHNTVSVMIPLMRQFFQQLNHDTDDPEDEAQKVAALILDEKGDFIDSTIMEMMLAGRPITDLVLIDPDLDLFRYNPLDPSQSADENAEKLGKVQKIISGGGGGGDNKYWDDTSKATIKYFLQLLEVYKPKEKIGLDDIARFMRDDQLATILCDEVEAKIEAKKEANEINEETYGMIYDAISGTRNQWINLAQNTKSILKTTINQMLSSLASNPRLQKVFCRDTNFSFKDLPNKGKIVLFRGSGIDKATAKLICVCLKIDFQTWQKRRNGSAASAFGLNTTRTVLFICDEYQEFVTCGDEGDQTFYGVSRSARTCAIVATQSLNSLKGPIKNQEQTNTLIQNITTWIFLRTTDKDTMELGALWAGQSKQEDFSQSQNTGGFIEVASNMSGGSGKDSSVSISRKLEENFRKDDFSKLITMTMEKSRSGPWYSEAIVYHYHDTDAEAESRCYKTKIPHYYYDKELRKRAGSNVSHLDNLFYDRNWQRKTLQRALVEIARVRAKAGDDKRTFLEKMATSGKLAPIQDPEEARRARILEAATQELDEQSEEANSKIRGKKLSGEVQQAKEMTAEDLAAIKEKRHKLMADQSNATSEIERKEIEREIGRLSHLLAFNQLQALSRGTSKPGTIGKEVLEANKNLFNMEDEPKEITEPAEGDSPETSEDTEGVIESHENGEEVWDPMEGIESEKFTEDSDDDYYPMDEEEQRRQIQELLHPNAEKPSEEEATEEENEEPNPIIVEDTEPNDPNEDPVVIINSMEDEPNSDLDDEDYPGDIDQNDEPQMPDTPEDIPDIPEDDSEESNSDDNKKSPSANPSATDEFL